MNKGDMNKGILILKWTIMAVLFVLVVGFVTMLLWNWLMPSIFNLPKIEYWQALGLLLLSKILFGGFSGKCSGSHQSKLHWKSRYQNKLAAMSPEDREKFKARVWEKWCSSQKNTSSDKSGTSNG